MNKIDAIRAWKDPVYRATLSEEELAALPVHPAGLTEVSDEQLRTASGAAVITTAPTCTNYTFLNLRECCPPATTAPTCTEYTYAGLAGCCPKD